MVYRQKWMKCSLSCGYLFYFLIDFSVVSALYFIVISINTEQREQNVYAVAFNKSLKMKNCHKFAK